FAILKPALDEAASGKNAAEFRATESLQLDLPASVTASGASFLGSTNANALPPPPRENPYLQGIVAPAPAPSVFVPPPAPIVTAPPARVAPPVLPSSAPPVVAPASKIPDFAKPAHDE